jgi:energy-coupling factor transporter ATP-binding protein EcfA2
METISPPEPFSSLLAMRESHLDLLESREKLRESPEYLDLVNSRVRRFVATGALMESASDRRIGQSIIDYWTTELQRSGDPDASAMLAPFDPRYRELGAQQCPYMGLESFQVSDHQKFFGREEMVEQLARMAEEKRLVMITGESGSGKSSLLRAGLLFVVQSRRMFLVAGPILPGSQPIEVLAALFPGLRAAQIAERPEIFAEAFPNPQTDKVLLAVDQFEEVFTLCSDVREQRVFAQAILGVWKRGHAVAATVRDDIWNKHVDTLGAFGEAFRDAATPVSAMSATALRNAIEAPVTQVGLTFEPGLVDQLIADVEKEPSALPLLQFTLLQLWNRRQRNPWETEGQGRITWDAYRRLRGPRWALAEMADQVYSEMTPQAQEVCRVVLLRLAKPADNYEVLSCRELMRDLKTIANSAEVQRVVDTLTAARLLRITHRENSEDDQVEVAHEALIRNWPKLIGWLNEERIQLRERFRLREAARLWIDRHDSGLLWSGFALDAARQYEDLSNNERAFLDASIAEADAKLKEKKELEQRREDHVRNLRIYVASLAVLVLALAVLALVAYQNEEKAKSETGKATQALADATTNYNKSLYNFDQSKKAAAALENVVRVDWAKQDKATAPTQNKGTVVYILLQDEKQRPDAEEMTAKLIQAGYHVGKPRVLSFGPDATELRYFQPDQADDAKKVADLLGSIKTAPVSWGKGDANWFEIWFGKPN